MEFLRDIFKFFINKEYSFTLKFLGFLSIIFLIFCIDNFLGFSFYYSNNQKINQLRNIESLKRDCADNKNFVETINDIEKEIINRKNIIDNFFELFSGDPVDEGNKNRLSLKDTIYIVKHDTIILRVESDKYPNYIWSLDSLLHIDEEKNKQKPIVIVGKPHSCDSLLSAKTDSTKLGIVKNGNTVTTAEFKSRSKLWNTLSSSFALIILLIILFLTPFYQNRVDWNLILGVLLFAVIDVGFIWIFQYLLGLIPVIMNKPWINYILNIVINILLITLLGAIMAKKKNK